MKKVAVLQSNYIPWKGYFDIINDVDLFIFYDDVQYTKNDWRNRNKLKTPDGAKWITVPAGTSLNRLICEVLLTNDTKWQKKHFESIRQFYQKAPYFSRYKAFLEDVYLVRTWTNLSDLNQFLIKTISTEFLGIRTEFKDSREFQCTGDRLVRLINLIKTTKGDVYLSGPSAKNYINETILSHENIELVYKDYADYPEYLQFYPPFDHYVSIFDLLFHTGPDAPYFIWGWRDRELG